MSAWARAGSRDGEPAVILGAGSTRVTFLPGLGMLGASLRDGSGEHLSLHGGPAAFAAGHTTGLPLLAPWANRLASSTYRVGRTTVELDDVAAVGRDGNGLPMHGAMLGRRPWQVVFAEADVDEEPGDSSGDDSGDDAARLQARFPFGDHADLLAAFPFPHDLVIDVAVRPGAVSVDTTIEPTGRRHVPVSFGWHPYFRLPGVRRRDDLVVHLPARQQLELDERMIPTGVERRRRAEAIGLAGRTFDDAYRLGRTRVLGLSTGDAGTTGEPRRSLTLELDANYPFAQVYAPAGRAFVALEPMTAPANALVTGDHPTVAPGDTFTAGFTIRLT